MKRHLAFSTACLIASLAILAPAALAAGRPNPIDLPPEGSSLNRTHVQFRWDTFYERLLRTGPVSAYLLEIVEDQGDDDPFSSGLPVEQINVTGPEPRTVVTSGLRFGASYAWRVQSKLLASPGPAFSEIHRFSTDAPSPLVPEMTLTVPAGAAAVEPGLTCWSSRRNGFRRGFILCVEPSGELVLQFEQDGFTIGDMRQLENGRLLYLATGQSDFGQNCRRAHVETLDGRRTWTSPTDHCDAQMEFPVDGTHHEAFPMPADAPRGANFLLLDSDNRRISFTDEHDGVFYPDHYFRGDQLYEMDRHTKQILKRWNTFDAGPDAMCLEDHLPPEHPWGAHPPNPDITHANAVIYDVETGRAAISIRQLSRIVVIDWESGDTLFAFGERESSPGGDPFPCAPEFGDNLFSAQHAPEFLPNGNMMVFDNGNFREPLEEARQSRAIEIAFDDLLHPTSAWIVGEYRLVAPDLVSPAYSNFVGDADRMPNGNALTVAGRTSYIMEADPDGNTIWHLQAGLGWPGSNTGDPATAGTLIYRVEKIATLIRDTPGDFDGDWDLDLADLAALQVSYGAGPLAYPDTLVDQDGDDDLDTEDVVSFAYWMTGPGR
jgi:hypothetical protein